MSRAKLCGRASLVVISLSIGLLLANSASSQRQPPTLPARVDVCVPIDRDDFQRLLANELATIVDSEASERKLRGADVRLSCVDDVVEVALADASTTTTRRVDLRQVAQTARTRLMALTVAELVFAQLHDARSAPVAPRPEQSVQAPTPERPKSAEQPVPSAPPPKPSDDEAEESPQPIDDEAEESPEPSEEDDDDEVEESPEPSDDEPSEPWKQRLQLGAAGGVAAFSSTFELIPSVDLTLTVPLSTAFALKFSAQLGFASLGGTVNVDMEPVPATVRLTLGSLLLALLRVVPLGAFDLVAGPGVRGGLAFFRGAPIADLVPAKSSARWAAALVTLGLAYRMAQQLRVVAAFEVGYVALRPRALGTEHDEVVTELSGLWTEASLGLAWAF